MGIKDIYRTVMKGVKAGMLAIQDNQTLNEARIVNLIYDFNNSHQRKWMLDGARYFEVENDIKGRVQGSNSKWKANNKLAHAKYHNMVDEKVSYLLSRPYSLDGEDDNYLDKLKDVLGKRFQYNLASLGYEASNKGIAWLQVYIDQQGKFKTMMIPSEQCIPLWKDNSHEELEAMIRVYNTEVWKGNNREKVTNVEVWTEYDVRYYKLESQTLIPYVHLNHDDNGPIAHYQKNGAWTSWGVVPFIPFKNNRFEICDLKFVKSLIDAYDMTRSEAANYVEEVKNLIFILKGYGGADLDEFMSDLLRYRAVKTDEDGGVDTLTPEMDITALREHYEQLKRDIIEDGQSVNKDLDKFGSAPSGVALKFMYAALDLKCNALEVEFKLGFEKLLHFINIYLNESCDVCETSEVEIIFNRDMEINETEVIENCKNSVGIISDKTIITNHPWIKDVEAEIEELESQEEKALAKLDIIPTEEKDEVDE